MLTTPRPVIDRVVRSTSGRVVEGLERLTAGGLNETYLAHLRGGARAVVRIARRSTPWFTDEEHLTGRARRAGVPAPEVIGVEHLEHDGHLLSFSVLQVLPGRALEDLAPVLPPADLERLVVDAGELLARIHGIRSDRGVLHDLRPPSADAVGRAVRAADELAGPASPARDLARWEVSAGDVVHDRSDWLRRGYARVTDPDAAAGGWVPAFAIDWALEVLGWEHPAAPARRRRCVDVIARSTTARSATG